MLATHQHTLRQATRCEGRGLHSGEPVQMTLLPAEPGQGIVFERVDVQDNDSVIPARYDLVTDTMLGTTLTNDDGVSVSTVEHLMAALAGLGVDNVRVQLNGPEVPIMDGSSEPFVFLLECAGVEPQQTLRPYLRVRKPVRVEQGESRITLTPYQGFRMHAGIAFDHALIGEQQIAVDFSQVSFKNSLCRARTFGFEEDVAKLRAMGLARGGSLDNAVVLGEERILNSGGLRYSDEFVRHKMLDCIGDFYLAGAQLLADVDGQRTGHGINNQLLRTLLADRDVWELVSIAEGDTQQQPLPAAVLHHLPAEQAGLMVSA